MHKSAATVLQPEISVEEVDDVVPSHENEDEKLLRLYQSIKLLKEVISSKILTDLKVCKESCEDAKTVIGALNDVKKQ